jgi:hypothetical protein
LLGIAVVVGSIAFLVARKPSVPKPAAGATSAATRSPVPDKPAPQVALDQIPPAPDDSGIKVEEDAPPTAHETTAQPGSRPRGPLPPSPPAPTSSKKKQSWREDPGF